MRFFLVLLLAGAASVMAQPGSDADVRATYQQREMERERLWKAKDYDKAAALLEEMTGDAAMMRISDIRLNVRYNLACAYSLAGRKEKALGLLREIIRESAMDPSQVERDTDFDNIRAEPDYKELIAAARAKWEAQNRFWNSPAMQTKYQENLGEDEKIAGLVKFWSEAKYNFAWFDRQPGLDWDAKMLEFLPRVRATRNTGEYYRLLMEFGALLQDGHTGVSPPRELQDTFNAWPPLRLALVEGRVLVARVYADEAFAAAGVRRGTELLAVDGAPVREYAEKFIMPMQPASSPQDREQRSLANGLLGGRRGSEVRLRFANEDGKPFEVTAARFSGQELGKRDTGPKWSRFELRMLDEGRVAYVALNTFGDAAIVSDFEKAWPEIRKAQSIILDVRTNGGGSSGYGSSILSHLIRRGGAVAAIRTRVYRPAYRAWGQGEEWQQQAWSIAPAPGGGFDGRIVLLTAPGTFSAAEDFASAFDMLKAGTIIGQPTGGSTGQPLMFGLPGGGLGRVCTLQERYADGREFVGTGIQPQVRVEPTVADFRAGKDTVLEAALAFLRQKP